MKAHATTGTAAAGANSRLRRTALVANPATLRLFAPTIRDASRGQKTRAPAHSKIVAAGSVFPPTTTVADVQMIHRQTEVIGATTAASLRWNCTVRLLRHVRIHVRTRGMTVTHRRRAAIQVGTIRRRAARQAVTVHHHVPNHRDTVLHRGLSTAIHPPRTAGQAREAVIVTRNHPPAPDVSSAKVSFPTGFLRMKAERATCNHASPFFFFAGCLRYQTPLSLPVILKATAAAEASGGSRLSRNVAGTFPRNAAWVICWV